MGDEAAADFLAAAVVADLRGYGALLTERLPVLPMVAATRSNVPPRRIKSEAPLPLPASRGRGSFAARAMLRARLTYGE